MNCYCGLTDLKQRIGEIGTTRDADLMLCLDAASRAIDDFCGRVFWTASGARVFTPLACEWANVDDCLSVSSLKSDEDGDGIPEAEWTQGRDGDFFLSPVSGFPKTVLLRAVNASRSFVAGLMNSIEATGVWGYGDGRRAAPWDALGVTLTVATAGGTTATVSAAGGIQAGNTLLVGTEQIHVSAISGTTLTIERGANDTTAAAHSAEAVNRAAYPGRIAHACSLLAGQFFRDLDANGLSREMMGDYNYGKLSPDDRMKQFEQMLGNLRRMA
ncbi:MAG: hypothetical protein ABFD60_07010 [Bryobacteraceae bacterium]